MTDRLKELISFDKQYYAEGFLHIAGVDEAGRGPLAGPVVAAAVIFPQNCEIPGIDDSKKLPKAKRERLFDEITKKAAAIGIGICDEKTIDKINILQATFLAMGKAVAMLEISPDCLLIDGNKVIPEHIISSDSLPQKAIIKGDSKSISIAAASIIAKVTRDRIMEEYDMEYPQYGFARHKGYPTKAHREAISRFGICEIHRRSFNLL